MYREIAGTDERVRANPGVRDRRVRATKVRLYIYIYIYIRADAFEPSLRKIRLMKIHCSDPEGGGWQRGSVQCWATIGPTAKRHLNGVSLADR